MNKIVPPLLSVSLFLMLLFGLLTGKLTEVAGQPNITLDGVRECYTELVGSIHRLCKEINSWIG